MDAFSILAVGLVVLLLVILIGLSLALLLRKPTETASNFLAPLTSLTQAIGGLRLEANSIAERVSAMERTQQAVGQNVFALGAKIAETDTTTKALNQTATIISGGIEAAQQSLAALQSQAAARQQLEQQTSESIRRLEAVIAGTRSKGAAGENIMDLVFSQLPAEWQVREFQVGSKCVEFGLRLPNNLVLPIDSKWPATNLLEEFLASEDPQEQQRLKGEIERAIIHKAKEVRKYIDPSITVNFCIAAIPDAVFALCPRAQVETMRHNVVLLSYSMFVPYLLLTIETVLKSCQDIDLQKLASYLDAAKQSLDALQAELEGRLSRSITMLGNSRDEMRVMLGRLGTGLTALQISTQATGSPEIAQTESSPPGALPAPEAA
jgi:DNA recombination protein RmuC